MKPACSIALFVLCSPALAIAAPADTPGWLDNARITIGLPLYVKHPDDRKNAKRWNQGFLHNEGLIADITWPVLALTNHTHARAGMAAGAFDNSTFRLSVFATFAGEIETYVTPVWRANIGAYAGAITGYEQALRPAFTPYVGTAYALNHNWQLGARGFWLPSKTLGGSTFSDSDAYVGTLTLSYQF